MKTVKKIWMNGKMKNWKDAKVHLLTHSLHYGSGIFEGIRFYNTPKGPAVFLLKEHTKRLFYSAKCMNMKVPYSQKEICTAILKTIKVNKVKSGYIRPIFYYGYGKMGLNPLGAPLDCAIAIWPWGSYLGEQAINVKTSSYIRIHPDSTKADAKICGHYVNSILAHVEAKKAGYHEALLLDNRGKVAEGPGENLFMVKDGKLITPKTTSILPGLTRTTIIKLSKKLGYKTLERDITPAELKKADELFFTGTAAEVTPIAKIDKTKISKGKMGPVTEEIKSLYMRVVKGKEPKYEKWLSYVD